LNTIGAEANAAERVGCLGEGVCVVIAAKDAASTIRTAVRSALAEPEVRRVIVVDDGSSDQTADLARAEGAGTDRLTVLQLPENCGPAYARNRAIDISDEPFIAILDADDAFLPGRFARLATFAGEWDLLADDIAFVSSPDIPVPARPTQGAFYLSLAGFVAGNLAKAGVHRGEYGFLKPVLRRQALLRTDCRYNPDLRLGEDYDLYARLLARGAQFAVLHSCGYRALVRPESLSGRHRTLDLQRLVEVDQALLRGPISDPLARAALLSHLQETRAKFHLRRFLDTRRDRGLIGACRQMGMDRPAWTAVTSGILRDKLQEALAPRASSPPAVRYLL
jgi:succinoglycan biosynthesis protein ExoU